MKRVGFLINFNIFKWFGGTYLIKNLIKCIVMFSKDEIKPILIVKKQLSKIEQKEFKNFELLKTNFFHNQSLFDRVYNKFLILIFGRSKIYDEFFLKHRIEILSHSNALSNSIFLGKKSAIKSYPFLADLQYLHYPQNFSLKNLILRKINIFMCALHSTKIIVSSNDVKNDLKIVSKLAFNKAKVSPFVFLSPNKNEIIKYSLLRKKFKLPLKYFYLPNQYWMHKNHKVVLNALLHLKNKNKLNKIFIISTGSKEEHRNTKYFYEIEKIINHNNLNNHYKYLGTVSFKEVLSLIYYSVAVIQPSKFEGRSSTVEQAKSIGKKIILSNIDIHREQNPTRSKYFSTNNFIQLSNLLLQTLNKYDHNLEKKYIKYAARKNKENFYKYYKNYIDIIS